jgi:hypothetical protein
MSTLLLKKVETQIPRVGLRGTFRPLRTSIRFTLNPGLRRPRREVALFARKEDGGENRSRLDK